jgi:hypothetical protein
MYDQSVYRNPLQDFSKLPCKKCKLKTAHVKVSFPSRDTRYVWLRCRASRTQIEIAHDFTIDELLDLPTDGGVLVGVA